MRIIDTTSWPELAGWLHNPQLSLGPPSLLWTWPQSGRFPPYTTGKTGFVQSVIGFFLNFASVLRASRCRKKTISLVKLVSSIRERTTQGCRYLYWSWGSSTENTSFFCEICFVARNVLHKGVDFKMKCYGRRQRTSCAGSTSSHEPSSYRDLLDAPLLAWRLWKISCTVHSLLLSGHP